MKCERCDRSWGYLPSISIPRAYSSGGSHRSHAGDRRPLRDKIRIFAWCRAEHDTDYWTSRDAQRDVFRHMVLPVPAGPLTSKKEKFVADLMEEGEGW